MEHTQIIQTQTVEEHGNRMVTGYGKSYIPYLDRGTFNIQIVKNAFLFHGGNGCDKNVSRQDEMHKSFFYLIVASP